MNKEKKVLFDDGKYKIIWDNGKMEALRYGEKWRDLVGDNLILSLCNKIEELSHNSIGTQMPTREDLRKILENLIEHASSKRNGEDYHHDQTQIDRALDAILNTPEVKEFPECHGIKVVTQYYTDGYTKQITCPDCNGTGSTSKEK